MFKYISKRLLMMIPVLLGVAFIIFTIMDFTPGDPARLILGEYAAQEDIDALREEMGLNEGFFVRFGSYIKGAVTGDFGKSYRNNLPVSKEVASRLPTTLKLTFLGMTLAVFIGIPIGVLSAVKQYTIIDNVTLIAALLLTSIPGFWLGLMLILFFSLRLDLLPATGIDSMKHFIMPSITLAAGTMATLIRMTRSTMLEVIRQDYIRTAKAKGGNEKRIIFIHALRNALLPVITLVGVNFGILLGGAVVIEAVFAIPGLGTLMIGAVRAKDTPVLIATVTCIALIGGLITLIVDILYIFIDPRIKSQYVKGSR